MGRSKGEALLSFGGHLDVLRKMLFRILGVSGVFTAVIFCMKDYAWQILLAPSEWDFCTYQWIEDVISIFGVTYQFEHYHVDLIATDLSAQFMSHVFTSCYLGALCASPYIMLELFHFVSPALYDSEKKYSRQLTVAIYMLFIFGVLMSYFVLFPISFRFLATYSVSERVHSMITLDSYIGTFITLTFLMGIVFQLPVIAYIMAKIRFVSSNMLSRYRRHAFIIIMVVAALITPPDVMTLVLVSIPLYLLFELSIMVIRVVERKG